MGKFLVVRHGETNYNVERRFTGQSDIPLNKNGEKQAAELAESMKETAIDIIYSSPLERAVKTAEYINKYHNLPVFVSDALKEICMGAYEGMNIEEVKKSYREFFALNPDNGRETEEHVIERVYGFIDEIKEKYPNSVVLVTAHGFIAKIFYRYFNNPTEEDFRAYKTRNCQLAEYEY